jgi:predicted protein tyrosine phosphatase
MIQANQDRPILSDAEEESRVIEIVRQDIKNRGRLFQAIKNILRSEQSRLHKSG